MKGSAPNAANTLILGVVSVMLLLVSYLFMNADQDTVALVLLVAGLIGVGITFLAGLAGIDPRK